MARLVAALAVGLGLAGCAGPYDRALDDTVLQRPEPPFTPSDQQALAPYLAAPYFRDQP